MNKVAGRAVLVAALLLAGAPFAAPAAGQDSPLVVGASSTSGGSSTDVGGSIDSIAVDADRQRAYVSVPELDLVVTIDQQGLVLVAGSPGSNGTTRIVAVDLGDDTGEVVADNRIIRAGPRFLAHGDFVYVGEESFPNSPYKLDLGSTRASMSHGRPTFARMTSASLNRWRNERADLLDQLIAAHGSVAGTGVGRRWTTSELNRALLLRLAAQFQGFTKDLHQETAVAFGSLAQPGDPAIARVVATGLQANRELDRQNAQESSLARREHLKWFNKARNGLAHDDPAKVDAVVAAGYRLDLGSIRRWRSNLDGLAGTMDAVLAAHLARLFNAAPPW